MRIAVEGCSHGELDKIYETIGHIEDTHSIKIDLLLCCGDFQAVRDKNDMMSMAVPPKYRKMADFHKYYNGERRAPVLTIFIGGNHEAATHLWQLPFGGWVAENIFYLGYAGVLNFGGLRIAGMSGIYKERDYYKGHFEAPPFDDNSMRSFYHVRSFDTARMKLLSSENKLDVFLSHDWPRDIAQYGNSAQLMRFKPFLREEIENHTLGSAAGEELLSKLKPAHYFAGHMHAKFAAVVPHSNGTTTKFLALDKCLPKRNFMQVLEVGKAKEEPVLKYDREWITILRSTAELVTSSPRVSFLTEFNDSHALTPEKLKDTSKICGDDFRVVEFIKSNGDLDTPQTDKFCARFQIENRHSPNKMKVAFNAGPITIAPKHAKSAPKQAGKLRTMSVLPKPKASGEKPASLQSLVHEVDRRDDFDDIQKPNILQEKEKNDDDEFGSLKKPATTGDDLSLSGSSSSDSDDESDDSDSSKDDNGANSDAEVTTTEDYDYNSSFNDTFMQSNAKLMAFSPGSSSESANETKMELGKLLPPPSTNKTNNELITTEEKDETNIVEYHLPAKPVPEPTPTHVHIPEVCSTAFTPSPKKKPKIIRRNQQMYTPTED